MTPAEIWPMIAGAAVVVFGAGQLVEKIRNGKYVAKDMCAKNHETATEYVEIKVCDQIHKAQDECLKRIDRNMGRIWKRLDGGHGDQEGME